MILYDRPPQKLVCIPHPPPKQECCIDRIHSLRKPQHGRHFGEAPYDQCRQKPGCTRETFERTTPRRAAHVDGH